MKTWMLLCVLSQVPLPPPTAVRVHDGDTIEVDFTGLPDVFGKRIGVRLLGIDTPELHDPDPIVCSWAVAARDYLNERVRKTKVITLSKPRRDKFFRLDARSPTLFLGSISENRFSRILKAGEYIRRGDLQADRPLALVGVDAVVLGGPETANPLAACNDQQSRFNLLIERRHSARCASSNSLRMICGGCLYTKYPSKHD